LIRCLRLYDLNMISPSLRHGLSLLSSRRAGLYNIMIIPLSLKIWSNVISFRLLDPVAPGVGTFYGIRPVHGS
jgi:hypothetical protein